MKIFRSLPARIFTCVLVALASVSAQAQSEASRRPLTLVVPFTAGAANDVLLASLGLALRLSHKHLRRILRLGRLELLQELLSLLDHRRNALQ